MPTDPASTCRECGAELPAGTAPGQCPNCLLGLGLAATEEGGQKSEDGAERLGGSPNAASEIEDGKSQIRNYFGDYELLEEIGRGGMGVVYKARQNSLDRIVALKLLLFGPHAPPESVKRFRAEAVATAALQHPNIVALHEVGVHQGQHFLVMDFVEGRSLARVISDLRFQISDCRRMAGYVKTIAEAVHYAHERGLLHRDLKPSNILIDGQNQPRVTDFGSCLERSQHIDHQRPEILGISVMPLLTSSETAGEALNSPATNSIAEMAEKASVKGTQ